MKKSKLCKEQKQIGESCAAAMIVLRRNPSISYRDERADGLQRCRGEGFSENVLGEYARDKSKSNREPTMASFLQPIHVSILLKCREKNSNSRKR